MEDRLPVFWFHVGLFLGLKVFEGPDPCVSVETV